MQSYVLQCIKKIYTHMLECGNNNSNEVKVDIEIYLETFFHTFRYMLTLVEITIIVYNYKTKNLVTK